MDNVYKFRDAKRNKRERIWVIICGACSLLTTAFVWSLHLPWPNCDMGNIMPSIITSALVWIIIFLVGIAVPDIISII